MKSKTRTKKTPPGQISKKKSLNVRPKPLNGELQNAVEELKDIRSRLGYSKAQMGKAIGVSAPKIALMEAACIPIEDRMLYKIRLQADPGGTPVGCVCVDWPRQNQTLHTQHHRGCQYYDLERNAYEVIAGLVTELGFYLAESEMEENAPDLFHALERAQAFIGRL